MGHKDEIIKKLRLEIEELHKYRGDEDDSALQNEGSPSGMVDWAKFEDIVPEIQKTISDSRTHKWSWARNWDCKYIDLRIDMRDGHCILSNRKHLRISLEQLRYQYSSIGNEADK